MDAVRSTPSEQRRSGKRAAVVRYDSSDPPALRRLHSLSTHSSAHVGEATALKGLGHSTKRVNPIPSHPHRCTRVSPPRSEALQQVAASIGSIPSVLLRYEGSRVGSR